MIYQRLKDLKEDADLKQCNIAKIIGTSENTYGRYERGEKEIPLDKAVILAEYYNVSLDYIAGRTNDKAGLKRSDMTAEEMELIQLFRKMNDKHKIRTFGILDAYLKEEQEGI